MPKEYERNRDKLISRGVPVKEAKRQAAIRWNIEHPTNTNPWRHEGKTGHKR